MATQEQDHVSERIIHKLASGQRLDEAERAHLAACEVCLNQVLSELDAAARTNGRASGTGAAPTADEPSRTRPEAQRALEHGRRVFEREFGIKLSEIPSQEKR